MERGFQTKPKSQRFSKPLEHPIMTSSWVTSQLAELESQSMSPQVRTTGYKTLLDQITAISEPAQLSANLAAFIDSILGESLGIVSARPLLGNYVEALKNLEDPGIKTETGQHSLQVLEPRVVSFEDQDASIREIVADAFQSQENYIEAAKVLQGIQLESSQRNISDDVKVQTWIRICRLYLEEDDTTSAETYLNRAKTLLYKVEDKELNLVFQLSQARILDSRRRFLEASQSYHQVSGSAALADEERNIVLSKAISCAVLAPAGPQRSRVLGKLFKDERAARLEEFGILEKMFLDRLITPSEVSKFADKLSPHQLAETADGSTVLAKAVIEHNLLGASKLYCNLGVAELGALLGLEAEKAEDYAARMLEQGRLRGDIDQIDGVIFFDDRDRENEKRMLQQTLANWSLRSWDKHVQGIVEDIERVSSLLQPLYNETI